MMKPAPTSLSDEVDALVDKLLTKLSGMVREKAEEAEAVAADLVTQLRKRALLNKDFKFLKAA
jgi:hypothetical protein